MHRRAAVRVSGAILAGTRRAVQERVTETSTIHIHSQLQPRTFVRGYAKDRYFFPDDRNESLGHAQVFKVSQVIEEDHHQLEYYYGKIIGSNDPDEQKRYQNAFVWELARNSIAKELVVYPALERNVSDGSIRAEQDRSRHQKIKEQLYEFQKLNPRDSPFMPAIRSLWKDLSKHIKEKEKDDLKEFEESLSMTESKELAASFDKTKSFTPTRSHPGVPNKPPFETAAGLMTAPLDKIKDLFRKFPDDDKASSSH